MKCVVPVFPLIDVLLKKPDEKGLGKRDFPNVAGLTSPKFTSPGGEMVLLYLDSNSITPD